MVVVARERHTRALGVLSNCFSFRVGCARAASVAEVVAGDAAAEVAGFEAGGLGLGLRAALGLLIGLA